MIFDSFFQAYVGILDPPDTSMSILISYIPKYRERVPPAPSSQITFSPALQHHERYSSVLQYLVLRYKQRIITQTSWSHCKTPFHLKQNRNFIPEEPADTGSNLAW